MGFIFFLGYIIVITAKDYTGEMKELENRLKENSKFIEEKNNQYLNNENIEKNKTTDNSDNKVWNIVSKNTKNKEINATNKNITNIIDVQIIKLLKLTFNSLFIIFHLFIVPFK